MKIRTVRNAGFTLIEIMIVVSVVGLLAAIAVPNYIHSRNFSQTNACINNLRQIDGAVQEWATERNKTATTPVDYSDISCYLRRTVICPAAGSGATFDNTYSLVDCQTRPTCNVVSSSHILAN